MGEALSRMEVAEPGRSRNGSPRTSWTSTRSTRADRRSRPNCSTAFCGQPISGSGNPLIPNHCSIVLFVQLKTVKINLKRWALPVSCLTRLVRGGKIFAVFQPEQAEQPNIFAMLLMLLDFSCSHVLGLSNSPKTGRTFQWFWKGPRSLCRER